MATFQKFNQFVEDVHHGVHDFSSDSFKVCLTLVAPVATDSVFADLTEIAAGNGYTATGNSAALTSSGQTSGVYKLVLADPVTWTDSGGLFANFRYAVLYNDTPTVPADPLIGFWDYGSTIDMAAAETFDVDFSAANGIFTTT